MISLINSATLRRSTRCFLVLSAAAGMLLAACSTNAGFGTPASNPQPLGPGYPGSAAASPLPSGSVVPMIGGEGDMMQPSANASPLATASPLPNTLTIEGASLHLAYDGAAADPAKAPRLLELAFALQNTTKKPEKIADIKVRSDKTVVADQTVAVTAAAEQTSQAAFVTLKTADDPLKYKQLTIDFINDAKKTISTQTLDVPQQDFAFTPLSEKHPKGGVSIDSVEISRVDGPGGLHFECTFALTNAGTTPAQISHFTITPPKNSAVKVPIVLLVPGRSTSGFVSIVLPFDGKALPAGTYTVMAMQGKATVAKGAAILL